MKGVISKRDAIIKRFFHEAELLIILFNMNPVVQVKSLKKIKVKDEDINKFLKISTLFNKRKDKLIIKRKPKNRQEVILIENEVMRELYEPRILRLSNCDKELLVSAEEWLKCRYPKALIINHKMIDKLELIMDLNDRSVDFLVFTNNKIISYKVIEEKNKKH